MTTSKTQSSRRWQDQVKPFRAPSVARSVWQLVSTLGAFVGLWALMLWSLDVSYWLTLALAIPAGGLTVRFFIINHDCGHGSFFRSRRWNDIVGFWTGALSYTPYRQWRYGHALHHASSGQIEERGIGYFWVMTVSEYEAASWGTRLWYRVYSHPLTLLLVGGLYAFLFEYRLSFRSGDAKQRRGVWATNVVLLAAVLLMGWWVGFANVFLIQLPICFVAATAGLALFYVQHHYEGSYWEHGKAWDYEKAALEGSSYIKLPRVLEWFAGSINYHHIHHLAPRIPNYRLREAHHAVPMFREVEPLTWRQMTGAWRLRLIDDETREWTTFRAARTDDEPTTTIPVADPEPTVG